MNGYDTCTQSTAIWHDRSKNQYCDTGKSSKNGGSQLRQPRAITTCREKAARAGFVYFPESN